MTAEELPGQHGGDERKILTNPVSERTGTYDQATTAEQPGGVQRIVLFNEIAGGTSEVIIEHEGQKYRLRATRNGRLLLNK